MSIFQELHTGWEFFEPESRQWLSAQVPGCIHTDLRRHELIPDPFWGSNEKDLQWIEERDWSYRCRFDCPAEVLREEVVELVAASLDTLATIVLNGVEVARTANMFVGYRFPVKGLLRAGANELEIRFANPMDYIRSRQKPTDERESNDFLGGCHHIRKEQCSFGWDWGPRFATCGVVGNLSLEAWTGNRLRWVEVRQEHAYERVHLDLRPHLERPDAGARYQVVVRLRDALVVKTESLAFEVPAPELWWPNAMGDQPLYEVQVSLLNAHGEVQDLHTQRLGLRTILLDRHADEFGESFQFVVNGKPIFAKGANWVPAHAFITEATDAIYEDLLDSAARANMNMLRVWGGGIYEPEVFYRLCDEKGLLVWQDFMFACALYPGTEEFLALVRTEAEYQVQRLAHHACLALWCGNNELEQMPQCIVATPERKGAFETIFYGILPDAVAAFSPAITYWPGSPHNPEGYEKGANNERAGDSHFWEVWHNRAPVSAYEETGFRFCSEFGMQSYSSPEVAATFCPPEDFNVFAPAMENHQKNRAGNQIILDYVSRRYRFPKDYASLAYLSQLNQAYCMKIGVEHFRRSMPRTMGALYWQYADCWPVFSWSSVEFGGRWKALHWAARRFFAPELVSAQIPGGETLEIGNVVVNTVDEVHLHTVYEAPRPAAGQLRWTIFHLDGRVLEEGSREVKLVFGDAGRQQTLSVRPLIQEHGERNLLMRVALDIRGRRVSQDMIFFTAPRFVEFKREPIQGIVEEPEPGHFQLRLVSSTFHHQTVWQFGGLKVHGEDNYLDLYPGEERVIRLEPVSACDLATLRNSLTLRSLVDSY